MSTYWRRSGDEAQRLREQGFDGLYLSQHYSGDACGCTVDDLYPCGKRHPMCRPARLGADGLCYPAKVEPKEPRTS